MKIDATGLLCPEPIMMLHKAIQESEDGALIELLSTDPSTERDIIKFCDFLGHTLVDKKIESEVSSFIIRRKSKLK
jgi:tRNA 2-thiouridine synthesizing protein A|tara:strand:+ start:203 stop:430 length:228 start_codon:yes stop_codon:yes gene_type:complete